MEIVVAVLEQVSSDGVIREEADSEMEGIWVSDSERLCWREVVREEEEGNSPKEFTWAGGVNEMTGFVGRDADDEDLREPERLCPLQLDEESTSAFRVRWNDEGG